MRHRGVEFLTGWFLPEDVAAAAAERAAFAAAAAVGATIVNVGADFQVAAFQGAEMVARSSVSAPAPRTAALSWR